MNRTRPATAHPEGGRASVLLAIAADIELQAIARGLGVEAPATGAGWSARALAPGIDVVLSGVGKANSAGAVARALDVERHHGVISLGIGGSLPGGPALGALVMGSPSVFADEGIGTPEGFRSCRAMGFPLVAGEHDEIRPDAAWAAAWAGRVDLVAPIATVSTCSGADALARGVASRTGALVEAMEGAAAGLAARAIDPGIPFAELRVVSNTTGDRESQRWAMDEALDGLGRVLGRVGLIAPPD